MIYCGEKWLYFLLLRGGYRLSWTKVHQPTLRTNGKKGRKMMSLGRGQLKSKGTGGIKRVLSYYLHLITMENVFQDLETKEMML